MKAFFKNITINKFTTKIILEHGNCFFEKSIKNELEAVGLLLGDYKNLGAKLHPDKYKEFKEKFDKLLGEVSEIIH